MNVNVVRLKPIEKQLKRIADYMEIWMAAQGVHVEPHKPDTSGPEPEVLYTDEERDWLREWQENEGRIPKETLES